MPAEILSGQGIAGNSEDERREQRRREEKRRVQELKDDAKAWMEA